MTKGIQKVLVLKKENDLAAPSNFPDISPKSTAQRRMNQESTCGEDENSTCLFNTVK